MIDQKIIKGKHDHIKPNCDLCMAMWRAGVIDGKKELLEDLKLHLLKNGINYTLLFQDLARFEQELAK